MAKSICFFVFTLLVSNICRADTIDYWHLYYNKIKVKEFDQSHGGQTLVFKITEIKNIDSITVRYFRDTPCFDCLTTLIAEDEKRQIFLTNNGKGTSNPVSLALKDILKYKEKIRKGGFEVYYSEGNGRTEKAFLFRIKLE